MNNNSKEYEFTLYLEKLAKDFVLKYGKIKIKI